MAFRMLSAYLIKVGDTVLVGESMSNVWMVLPSPDVQMIHVYTRTGNQYQVFKWSPSDSICVVNAAEPSVADVLADLEDIVETL